MAVYQITTIILLCGVFCFIALERKVPYRKGLPLFREGFWVDLVWYTFIQSYVLKILIFDYIILPVDQRWHLSSLQIISDWPVALQVLFFLVTHDFYIYWFHRWQHSSKVLWRTHEAHHSNKEVDWLSGSRSHSIEILINQTIEFAPIILLGADPVVVPVKALLDAVFGMFIHSNIDCRMGRLGYIFNGPQMHQWHHSNHRRVFYSNYGTKFSVWDFWFGTAYLPEQKPVQFGLPYDYPKDYFLQHAFAFNRLNETEWKTKTFFRRYSNLRPSLLLWMKQKWKRKT